MGGISNGDYRDAILISRSDFSRVKLLRSQNRSPVGQSGYPVIPFTIQAFSWRCYPQWDGSVGSGLVSCSRTLWEDTRLLMGTVPVRGTRQTCDLSLQSNVSNCQAASPTVSNNLLSLVDILTCVAVTIHCVPNDALSQISTKLKPVMYFITSVKSTTKINT